MAAKKSRAKKSQMPRGPNPEVLKIEGDIEGRYAEADIKKTSSRRMAERSLVEPPYSELRQMANLPELPDDFLAEVSPEHNAVIGRIA